MWHKLISHDLSKVCHKITNLERVIKVKTGTVNDWWLLSNSSKLGIHWLAPSLNCPNPRRSTPYKPSWSVDPWFKFYQWKKITKMKWSNLMGSKSWVRFWPMAAQNKICFGHFEIFLTRIGLISLRGSAKWTVIFNEEKRRSFYAILNDKNERSNALKVNG